MEEKTIQNTNEYPEVSIACAAYNHETFIRGTLDSFLMQKTDFPFEVIVHDDASTDGTTDIIREYHNKYPDIIKPLFQSENQYSQGKNISVEFIYPHLRGKYTAICEGDDYWTDPLKLQKQYDYLQNHPEIDICTHRAMMTHDEEQVGFIGPEYEECVIPVEEVIVGGGGFVATNSIMIRTENLTYISPFREILSYDYTIQIQGALRGGMGYLSDCMSVYRYLAPGSWSTTFRRDNKRYFAHKRRVDKMFGELDRYTDGRYSDVIQKEIRKGHFNELMMKEDYRSLLTKEYRDILREKDLKTKVKILLYSLIGK